MLRKSKPRCNMRHGKRRQNGPRNKGLVRLYAKGNEALPKAEESGSPWPDEEPHELLLLQLKNVLRSLEVHMATSSSAADMEAGAGVGAASESRPSSPVTSVTLLSSLSSASTRSVRTVARQLHTARAATSSRRASRPPPPAKPCPSTHARAALKTRTALDEGEEALAKHKERYTCPLCQRTFLWLGHLKRHLRTHEGRKFYKCNECHFTTTRKSTMHKHAVSHMKQAPFRCPACPEEFATKAALLKHLGAAHCDSKQQQQKNKKKKKKQRDLAGRTLYQCPECAYASRQRRDFVKHLLAHMEKRHFGRRCCVVKFPDKKDDAHALQRAHHKRDLPLMKQPSMSKVL